ncbi:MAG: hypothetical protein K2N22_02810 [Clostridia bacterium]|nr:hypothetical protein [Clostridia bacterium]
MKKFALIPLCVLSLSAAFAVGCKKPVNYLDYISEMRYGIWLYSSDGLEVKIYRSSKETPYIADGIKSEMCDLTEVYVTLPKTYDEVELSIGSAGGEMNWQAVDNCYYISFADEVSGDNVEVNLTCGKDSYSCTAVSVLYGGVMDCNGAVKCVIEHDAELFKSMTENGIFCGEIYARLLYDEGCYYYVGVCGRDKNISAYLVDGERGKIIATKKITA